MKAIGTVAVVLAVALAAAAPASAGQAVAYQLNAAHTGYIAEPGLDPPFTRRWAIDLGQPTSYPVIAGGRVFVVARNPSQYGSRLYALRGTDGHLLWQRALGHTYYWAGIAYGAGRLYVVTYDGLVLAVNPATGGTFWSRQLGQYSFSSEPTFSGDTVYVGGAGSGGTLYALDAATGGVRWSRSVCCGDHSSPAVASGRVHVGYACDTYGFAATGGQPVWHVNDGCSGGGGRTVVVAGGRVYARDGWSGVVHDAATGAVVDAFASRTAPAIAGAMAYLVNGETLEAVTVPGYATRWSFSDGAMSVAPIVVNGAVIAGSATGNLYALERSSGRVLWCDYAGRAIGAPDEHNVSEPVTGLAAGEGLLVVPAGGLLVAYGAGGGGGCRSVVGSPAPGGGGTPTTGTPAPAQPSLTLRAGKTVMVVGQRTRLRGALSGVPDVSGRRIVLQADEWPFGRFRPVARTRTNAGGAYAFVARPPRNVRLRVRLAGETLVSPETTLYADHPYRIRVRDRGGRRPRIRYTVYAARGLKIRRKAVVAYVARGKTEPWRRVDRRRWQRKRKLSVSVTMRYPRGRLGRRDHWMLCVRESPPDGFGRSSEIEARCGQRMIPRTLR